MDVTARMTPAMRLNPYPFYRTARAMGGVVRISRPPVWNVFRHEDVRTVLSDHSRFSSRLGRGGGPESLITSDPPRHTQLRGLVNRAFTPRAVAGLQPRIESLAAELLDRAGERGEMDLVADFAEPLPVLVIADMLGIPGQDRARFKRWSDLVVASSDVVLLGEAAKAPEGYHEAMQAMWAYFRDVIADRRARPGEDLISGLVAAQIDGQGLGEEDILNFCWLLLVAGNITTTNLIANAVLTLLEHPEALARLREDPGLLPGAVEEVLRYRSPVQAMFRTTTEEVRIGRHRIPAGETVVAWIGSANRDAARFHDPDRFDITRSPNPHIAFGHGIHTCLGAPLARLEANLALGALIRRFPRLRRSGAEPLEPVEGFILHGVKRLPLAVG
jgi:cytochrome P450